MRRLFAESFSSVRTFMQPYSINIIVIKLIDKHTGNTQSVGERKRGHGTHFMGHGLTYCKPVNKLNLISGSWFDL